MVEIFDDGELDDSFATLTIDVYEVDDFHVPIYRLSFLKDFEITREHYISVRDCVALLLMKLDQMLESAEEWGEEYE